MDPALFIERACSQIGIQEPQRIALKHIAVRIINAVKDEWILTGRRRDAISAASIAMAMEALAIPLDFKALCNALKASEYTIKSRMREMKGALLTQARTFYSNWLYYMLT